MAEEQIGLRRDENQGLGPWTKLFSAFKVALDPKKLVLAAAGILVMAFGWWMISTFFYSFNSTPPTWQDYREKYEEEKVADAWKDFKRDLNRWTLLHRLAGTQPDLTAEDKDKYRISAVDFAKEYTEFEAINGELQSIRKSTSLRNNKVKVEDKKAFLLFEYDSDEAPVTVKSDKPGSEVVSRLREVSLKELYDAMKKAKVSATEDTTMMLAGLSLTVRGTGDGDQGSKPGTRAHGFIHWYELNTETIEGIKSRITAYIQQRKLKKAETLRQALALLQLEREEQYKPAGYLRTWPWFEQRGNNPFLIVASLSSTSGVKRPWGNGNIIPWLISDQVPVMIEPLIKLLTPVIYLFHPSADSLWNRLYLLCVLFWTLATWAFFGGAITRMAVVQVARHNEKVGLRDAFTFACRRYKSYFLCQFLPMIFLGFLALLLGIFGFFENLLVGVGDILLTAVFLPLALLFGLIMAVVLIGLIGWPLMYTTISAEGTDSFDAISRSYSYVFQAPWYYLGYCLLAVLYGAALVFFVGLMGSLTVYLTKFGMSLFPIVPNRDPSMLFMWAPTSYGWRDLLLYQAPHAIPQKVVLPSGEVIESAYRLSPDYLSTLQIHNYIGAFFVAFWTYMLFLVVIGFGYSFFWTATSVIYLLMRREVDDTEMDEIHFEEEDLETPYTATPGGAPEGAGTTGLPMVPSQTSIQPGATPTNPPSSSVVPAEETPSTPTSESSSEGNASDTTSATEDADKSGSNGESDGEKTEGEEKEKEREES
ncbi:MAG: hypothetical protein ACFCD0_27800 [Gemmataceae bacterium]